jgi:hypothetical protein
MISRLFNLRRYRGGPLFERLSTHHFDLGGIGLEMTVPASDFVMKEPPRMLNFPFQNVGWFDAHCRRRNIHEELSVFCEIWNYFPAGLRRTLNLLAMGSNERMGCLSISADLNRVEKGGKLDLNDPHSLGAYIKWEYDDFYETPEQGPYCKGNNYQVRMECGRKWKHGQPDQDEFERSQYEAALRNRLIPTPQKFDIVRFGNAQWTHFTLDRHGGTKSDYYCVPLSEIYYLEIEIEFRFEVSDKNYDILMPDMQRTAEWLLQHTKIAFPGKPESPLALPH